MKKLLTVSLVAMMAVSAARADIASTTYVDSKTGDISTLETTNKTSLTAAVNEVAGIAGAAATAENLSALQTTVSTLSSTVGTNKAAADQTQADLDVLEETVADIDAAYKAADTTLTNKFGDLGNQTVKAYVDAKTENIASSDTVSDLAGRVTTAEGEIETLTGAATVEGSVANAKKAGTDAAAALTAYKSEMTTALGTKQDTISDLATIRSGAAAGATAVQPAAINDMQVKSDIQTSYDSELSEADKNKKYTSVGYVESRIGGINTGLTNVNNTLLEHKDLIDAAQDLADDNALAIQNLDGTYVTDSAFTTFQATNTDAIAAAKKAGDDAQDGLDAYISSNNAALAGVKATAEAAVVANSAITGGTGSVITYDAKGLVTSGRALVASDIPTIEQSQVDGLGDALDGKQADSTANYQVGTADGSWMALNANLPQKCQADGVSCSLISVGGNISWEVIAK